MTTKLERETFFGSRITPYDGELNEAYDGLSYVDNHLTHIDNINGNMARGFYIGRTGRIIDLYAIKEDDIIGLGSSYEHAADALLFKQIRHLSYEERVQRFVDRFEDKKLYTVGELWDGHRKLTGSCYSGVASKLEEHGVSVDELMDVSEFIYRVENEQFGNIVKMLKPYYSEYVEEKE